MAAPTLEDTLTVDEYLASSCRPDCDFVDGHLEERNLGEYDHGRIQALLAAWFLRFEREWDVRVIVEQRVQVLEAKFRVPDICVTHRDRTVEQIVHHAPLICIEILSPDDSFHRMGERVGDYHRMGVQNVWLIDPAARAAFVCTPSGWNLPPDGKLAVPGTEIVVPLADIFADLDES